MNEQDLRDALREAMTEVEPPRVLTANSALTRAQRAQRRRRANLAGVGVGVAVVALVVGAVALNVPRPEVGTTGWTAPAAGTSTPTSSNPPTSSTARTSSTEQGDRTQRNGPQNDKSVVLLDTLDSVLPPGLAPATAAQMTGAQFELRTHQAQIVDRNAQAWEYEGVEPVAHPGQAGVGRVIVEVYDAHNTIPADPCLMARNFWRVGGVCEAVQIGGKSVELLTSTNDRRIGSVAAYRKPNGAVVYVAQSMDCDMSGVPGLPDQPLSQDQLANLVLTPGFAVA